MYLTTHNSFLGMEKWVYEKQTTELDGLLIRRIFIIVSQELRFLHFSLHKEVEEQEHDRFVIRVFCGGHSFFLS